MRKLKELHQNYNETEVNESVFMFYRSVFMDALVKKTSITPKDKCSLLLDVMKSCAAQNSVGYVNLNMLTYVLSNIEYLNVSFRRQICSMRANTAVKKTNDVRGRLKAAQFVYASIDNVTFKSRYADVLNGLSKLALGGVTEYKAINRVKNAFTTALTKNRSTAFFNVGTSSRVYPNKYDLFSKLLSTVVEYSAMPVPEMKRLSIMCEYTNPYAKLLKTSSVHHTMYKNSEEVTVTTNLNAVCSVATK